MGYYNTYQLPRDFDDSNVPTIDAMAIIIEGTGNHVRYYGNKLKAEQCFKKYFSRIKNYQILSGKEWGSSIDRRRKYEKKIASINLSPKGISSLDRS